MSTYRLFALSMPALLLAMVGTRAEAGYTLNFQNSLQPTTPAAGWSYLYNAGGAIGNSASYTALLPVAQTTPSYIYYDTNGSASLPSYPDNSGTPYYTFFGKAGNGDAIGHPGPGTTQSANEGYAIAAYTLSAGSSDVAITNGFLQNIDHQTSLGSYDGLDYIVYLSSNPTNIVSGTTAAGYLSSATFGIDLGSAAAGDTIYVAIGSRGNHQYDAFHLNYDITIATPEPSTLLLAGIGLVVGLGRTLRKRIRANA